MKRPIAAVMSTGRGIPEKVMTNYDFASIGMTVGVQNMAMSGASDSDAGLASARSSGFVTPAADNPASFANRRRETLSDIDAAPLLLVFGPAQ